MDAYSVPYAAFMIGFCEIIAIAWVYGNHLIIEYSAGIAH